MTNLTPDYRKREKAAEISNSLLKVATREGNYREKLRIGI